MDCCTEIWQSLLPISIDIAVVEAAAAAADAAVDEAIEAMVLVPISILKAKCQIIAQNNS